jgi:hypothetical protein
MINIDYAESLIRANQKNRNEEGFDRPAPMGQYNPAETPGGLGPERGTRRVPMGEFRPGPTPQGLGPAEGMRRRGIGEHRKGPTPQGLGPAEGSRPVGQGAFRPGETPENANPMRTPGAQFETLDQLKAFLKAKGIDPNQATKEEIAQAFSEEPQEEGLLAQDPQSWVR